MIDEALTMFAEGRGDLCRKKLGEAGDLDRDSVAPHYLLGLGYALTARNWKAAEVQFEACLQRDPNHVGSLNNAALAQIRQGKYPEALANWRRALEHDPTCGEIAHNLQRLAANAGRVAPPMPDSSKRRMEEMVAGLSGDAPQPPGGPSAGSRANSVPRPGGARPVLRRDDGWLYIPLLRCEIRPPANGNTLDDQNAVPLADSKGPIPMVDPWCLVCAGLGHVKCPVMACSAGTVPTARVEHVVVEPRTGSTAPRRVVERVACSQCRGKGRVQCPICRGGSKR